MTTIPNTDHLCLTSDDFLIQVDIVAKLMWHVRHMVDERTWWPEEEDFVFRELLARGNDIIMDVIVEDDQPDRVRTFLDSLRELEYDLRTFAYDHGLMLYMFS